MAAFILSCACTALIGFLGYSSMAASPSDATPPAIAKPKAAPAIDTPARDTPADDGRVRGEVTVFDDNSAAVTNLDPDLLKALRAAAADAQGTTFYVNSGWRSRSYQDQLLRDAISRYGSQAEAARWVATPDTSPHVSGDAVDIGKSDAMKWLARHGAAYGLCQIYGNEPWHFELRPKAIDIGCPRMYADPTHDPRMQQ